MVNGIIPLANKARPEGFTTMKNNHVSEIKSGFKMLCRCHRSLDVWRDWVSLMALTLSNSCDWVNYQPREKEYLSIVGKYSKEEVSIFVKMFSHLALASACPLAGDVLGEIYMSEDMGNKDSGQFFTPYSVCRLMASINTNADDIKKIYSEKGYLTISDPAVGAGATLLAMYETMLEAGVAGEKVYMDGVDIDLAAAQMAYVQLSLRGVAATIKHGNSLSNEVWSVWITPAFILNGWGRRLKNEYSKPIAVETEKEHINNDVSSPPFTDLALIRARIRNPQYS